MKSPLIPAFVCTASLLLSVAAPAQSDKTSEWTATLKSESASLASKAIACRQLGESGKAEAIPALAALLDDKVLSAYARSGLERIGGPTALQALRDGLKTVAPERLPGLLDSLGTLNDVSVALEIITLTTHPDETVSRAAHLALGSIASPEAIATLTKALGSDSRTTRNHAAAACLLAAEKFLKAGKRAKAEPLYESVRLSDAGASYRIGATRGAILSRDKVNQTSFCLEQLHSQDPDIRNVALLTLRDIPSNRLVNGLHGALQRNTDPDFEIQLISALEDCHNARTIEFLRSRLGHDHEGIRTASIKAIATLGGGKAAGTLLDHLNDSGNDATLTQMRITRMEGDGVDDQVLNRLKSGGSKSYLIALTELAGQRDLRAAIPELLSQAGGNADAGVRKAAFRTLRSLSGPNEVPALIDLIKQNPASQSEAVPALVNACRRAEDPAPTGEKILTELKAAEPSGREPWIRILTSIGYLPGLPAILETLEDSATSEKAIGHLGRWPGHEPVGKLLAIVEDPKRSSLRAAALKSTLQLISRSAENQGDANQLADWLKRAEKGVQSTAETRQLLSTLGRVPHEDCLEILLRQLENKETIEEAVQGILSLAKPLALSGHRKQVEEALQTLESIKNGDVNLAVARIRKEIGG